MNYEDMSKEELIEELKKLKRRSNDFETRNVKTSAGRLKKINSQLKIFVKENEKMTYELKRIRHNALNILYGLSGYIENSDWQGLTEYFYQFEEQIKDLKGNYIFSINNIKNHALKGLLVVKLDKAKSLGINVSVELENIIYLEKKFIKTTDLCELLGVYLDNAIEAASEAKIKKLNICILENVKSIVISIRNTFNEIPNVSDINRGISTKGKDRGIGLILSKNILRKYNNIIHNTFIEYIFFIQEIYIKKYM
ncbi:GHKL domain-containing protein [Clostridium sp. PL3]|uniref:GHKL domain-containing protein n=1 Tax=Clostridium thailandense TaxID=2794346 RepID=A0A949WW93_9CLOT|nr:GHKL domain-containing protein [Clostridium thailandense]MBV7274552.1 GHKL domain-containing protein [Clostridium thailandense]